jgi:hypothetical protein
MFWRSLDPDLHWICVQIFLDPDPKQIVEGSVIGTVDVSFSKLTLFFHWQNESFDTVDKVAPEART